MTLEKPSLLSKRFRLHGSIFGPEFRKNAPTSGQQATGVTEGLGSGPGSILSFRPRFGLQWPIFRAYGPGFGSFSFKRRSVYSSKNRTWR